MAARNASGEGPEPTTVTLATWFVPGAGFLLLGRRGLALSCFLAVEGLYALGWLLSEGRAFEFLDPELRGPFATLLSPEVGNLGAMIAQLKLVGFGPPEPRPFPHGAHLGSFLCSLSGLANACLMVHAHLLARRAEPAAERTPSPALQVAAAWAVPGLGHLLQGRRRRALIVFLLLIGLFVWGTALAGGTNLSRQRHFYYWAGQFLLGGPAFATELLSGRPPVTEEMPHVDVGLLFASMAGLLNVLAMLDVQAVAERRWMGRPDGVDAPLEEDAAPGAEVAP